MNPFLTGSQVYGTPSDKSDTDLVIFVDHSTYVMLRAAADPDPKMDAKYGGELPPNSVPLRFGKLNLLVCTCPIAFAVWKKATEELEFVGHPVTRDDAIGHFKKLRKLYNIYAPSPPVDATDPRDIPF